jgi:hypothetical protein
MPGPKDNKETKDADPKKDLIPLPVPKDEGKNIELKKFFTFNETGNIMMATTLEQSNEIQESVRKVFAEVSVFFAAMTKAMAETDDPDAPKEKPRKYSLYNYNALKAVIEKSGFFIHVTEMDILHTTSSFGVTFAKELVQGLLGLATGSGALGFAQAMVAAVGKEGLTIGDAASEDKSKVGNIVFVCEYLMGMPCISAIVVYVNCKKNSKVFKAGPCLKTTSVSQEFEMHKDTYMFVTPTFIHEYAGDLRSIKDDKAYNELVEGMKKDLPQPPAPAK